MKTIRSDEFYTKLVDIENELKHYKEHFKGKVVYCNCDNPKMSNFFYYFYQNFKFLDLKKLIASCYRDPEMDRKSGNIECTENDYGKATYVEYMGSENKKLDVKEIEEKNLKRNGDFRSEECIELLKKSDIIVTCPPFWLFEEYITQLMKYKKKFLVIGPRVTILDKDIFSFFKENKLWLGVNLKCGAIEFKVPSKLFYSLLSTCSRIDKDGNKFIELRTFRWFTNLDYQKRHEDLILHKKYNEKDYPKYDNYNAINVNKVKDIPKDYKMEIGVPLSFLDKYNPNQFEIIGLDQEKDRFKLNKEYLSARIVIKKRL